MRGGEINNGLINISNSIQEGIINTGRPPLTRSHNGARKLSIIPPNPLSLQQIKRGKVAAVVGTIKPEPPHIKQSATTASLPKMGYVTPFSKNNNQGELLNTTPLKNNRRFSAPPVLIRNKASRKRLPYGGGKKTRHRRMHKRRITRKHK